MARRGKKKSVTKFTAAADIEVTEQQATNSSQQGSSISSIDTHRAATSTKTSDQMDPAWTPLQLEQIKLSDQLDDYIRSFKNKLMRLNYIPTNRELVILFIMNLHPRWRRLVEPFEMSCSEWIEAAAFARLHCDRVSAILGCESATPNNDLFKTPESKALRDSNYFAFSECPSAVQKATSSIEHLLHKDNVEEDGKNVLSETSIPSEQFKMTAKPINQQQQQPTVKPSTSSNSSSSESSSAITQAAINTKVKDASMSKKLATSGSAEQPKAVVTTKSTTNIQKSDLRQEQPSNVQSTPTPTPLKIDMTKQPTASEVASATKVANMLRASEVDLNPTKPTDGKVVLPLTAAATFAQMVDLPVVEKPEGDIIFSEIPSQHKGVNLAFLELTINQKKARGLLAKLSWGSSAISLDCVKRLGLQMEYSDMFCLDTDWGNVSSLGICILPIYHPTDPNLLSNMQVQVLPSIYGGKVDLVLGADFFFFFKPALNIKSRSIKFMDKETPYIVDKLE